MPSYESAYLLCQQGALVRLVSIIITFQVFLCLSLLALVLGTRGEQLRVSVSFDGDIYNFGLEELALA